MVTLLMFVPFLIFSASIRSTIVRYAGLKSAGDWWSLRQ